METGEKMKKILIVEDDASLQEELKILLDNNGYEGRILHSFSNVAQAILTMDVDLENADTGTLADMGVLDTDTSNISLELSIAGLEEEGYTCQ